MIELNIKDNRKRNLNIRISEDRLSEIKNKAREENISLADFVISKCLGIATEEIVVSPERRKRILKKEKEMEALALECLKEKHIPGSLTEKEKGLLESAREFYSEEGEEKE